jgi:hypothetical protein
LTIPASAGSSATRLRVVQAKAILGISTLRSTRFDRAQPLLTGAHDIGGLRNARLTADCSITMSSRVNRDFDFAMARIALECLACNG